MDARLIVAFDEFRAWLSENKLSTSLVSFNKEKTFKLKELPGGLQYSEAVVRL